MMFDNQKAHKIKWSIIIGFLMLALFTVIGIITSAAASGNPVAKWILLILFGTMAILLASYAIGFIILTLIQPEEKEEPIPQPTPVVKKKTVAKRRTTPKKKAKKVTKPAAKKRVVAKKKTPARKKKKAATKKKKR